MRHALVLVMVAGLLALPFHEPTMPSARPDACASGVSEAADAAGAAAIARECGRDVEVLASRTAYGEVYAQPDGRMRSVTRVTPVRARDADGEWAPIDLDLRSTPDGVVPGNTSPPVVFSQGGDTPLVSVTATGRRFEMHWPEPLPEPTLSGATAVYADVLPGVDLTVTATASGFSHALRVRERDAAESLSTVEFGLVLDGLTADVHPGGGVTVVDADTGEEFLATGAARMWDSAATVTDSQDVPGAEPMVSSSTARVATTVDDGTLILTPDRELLTADSTVYPVTIDPTWTAGTRSGHWASVWSNFPDDSYWQDGGLVGDTATYGDAGVGMVCDESTGMTCVSEPATVRTYYRLDTEGVRDTQVLSADFTVRQKHSWVCPGSGYEAEALVERSYQIKPEHTWNNQPGWLGHEATSTTGANFGATCGGYGDVGFDVTSMVAAAADSGNYSVSLGMRAVDETTVAQWKRYDHTTATLEVLYNTVPGATTDAAVNGQPCGTTALQVDTRSPIVSATVSDADGTGALQHELYQGETLLAEGTGEPAATGTTQSWTPPAELADGTYRWRVRTVDDHAVGVWSDYCSFTVDATTAIITRGPHELIYDAAGRLVGISQPDGLTARYRYDAAGNLLSTQTYDSGDLSVLSTVPLQAPAGSEITVSGTGFSTDPTGQTVTIGGAAAEVTAATANRLTVVVPADAATGPVTVTASDVSADGPNDFVLGELHPEPVITGVSAQTADVGASITVTGSGFDTDPAATSVLLHRTQGLITAITPDSITVEIPEAAVTGPVTVRTPGGVAVTDTDLAIAPRGYSAAELTAAGRVAVDGDGVELPFTTAGRAVMFWFEGEAGDRLSLGLTADRWLNAEVFTFNPYGGTFARNEYDKPQELSGRNMAMGMEPLPSDGVYQVVVDAGSLFTGSMTATLSTTATGTLDVDGAAAAFEVTRAGQHNEFFFTATEEQALSFGFDAESDRYDSYRVTVFEPFGATLLSWSVAGPRYTLPFETLSAGRYRVRIGTVDGQPASAAMWLSSRTTTETTVDGPGVVAQFDRPGREVAIDFTGQTGQRLGLGYGDTDLSYDGTDYLPGATLVHPDGATDSIGGTGDIPELPLDGTYRLLLTAGSATGHATVHLSTDVEAGSLAVDGDPSVVPLAHPWQNVHLTFDGAAGDRLSLGTDDIYTNGNVSVVVTAPDGTELLNQRNANADLPELPQTGEYRVTLHPALADITSLSVYLSTESAAGTATVDGDPVAVRLDRAGQNGVVEFTGVAGDTVELTFAAPTFTGRYYYVSLIAPDGTVLLDHDFHSGETPIPVPALPGDGTYRIVIDPDYAATGGVSVGVATTAVAAETRDVVVPTCDARTGEPTAVPDRVERLEWGAVLPELTTHCVPPKEEDGEGETPSSVRTRDPDGWQPDTDHLDGADWVTDYGPATDADLGPDAPAGVTAVSGQVTAINGAPLAGVTVTVENETVRTDAFGRFLVTDVPAGRRVVHVDGSTADAEGASYGVFDIGVDVSRGETRRMNHPVYLPELDTETTVTVESPTTEDVVLTTPAIPGLEVHIPAGTTVRDGDGNVATELSITPIPIDRPPFPLPASQVPIYFTVQPGGGSLFPAGGRIVYPNYTDQAPGTRMDFWFYDPENKGWHIYGKGTVTGDGKQVVPDADTEFYRLTGAMTAVPGINPPVRSPAPGGVKVGDPVDVATGLLVDESTDLFLDDVIPLDLTRTYQQGDVEVRPFGVGMNFSYNYFPWSPGEIDDFDYLEADLYAPDGSRVHYERITPGEGPGSFVNAAFAADPTPTMFSGSTMAWNGHGWDITLRDGTVYVLGDEAPLQSIRDRYGNTVTVTREWIPPDSDGRLRSHGKVTQVTSPNGKWIRFSYDDPNFDQVITKAEDSLGRTVLYDYDDQGHLISVTDPDGGVTGYTYDANGLMTTITDARGVTFLTNVYDAQGRVAEQTVVDEGLYTFDYTENADGAIVETLVTHPEGDVDRYTFNAEGQATSETFGYGTSLAQTTTIERDDSGVLPTAYVDELGRRTELEYNEFGEVVSTTVLAGTSEARTESSPRDGPFGQLSSYTDHFGAVTEYDYGADGALSAITDPLGNTTTFAVNGHGQVTETTDAAGNTTTTTYLLGDPVAATDAAGETTRVGFDAAGRPVRVTDPLGATTTTGYDVLGRISEVVDPLGRTTSYEYDAIGNNTKVVDPRGGQTVFTYDAMGRVDSVTDPLGATETLEYDGNGNLAVHTSRAGVVTEFDYDVLDRKTEVRYGVDGATAESTTTFGYDAGNRLTSTTDSIDGDSTFQYDGLDRTTVSATPQGTVGYEYGTDSQWRAVSVDGLPVVTYHYDADGAFVSAERGGATVASITRDALGRQDVVTTGATTQDYDYDAVGDVTGITYTAGGSALGELTYVTDAAGRPVSVAGSLATATIPDAFGPATYDAANRLTGIDGTTIGYDADGNLTADGTTTYEWDARGQLVGLTAPGMVASFGYGADGQRSSRTVNGTTVEYLYDGLNPLRETSGGDVIATQVSAGLDQHLLRDTGATQLSYLTDMLGSTIAVADQSGAVTGEYAYEPFGETTTEGDDGANPYRFTGREDDGTGLYQYRARYYSPGLQRFISEDPIGFSSGDTNLHAYVLNQPTALIDPMGTKPGQSGGRGNSCLSNSFTPDTPVLMADGTHKPIEDVELGDEVVATDPETGETGAREVTGLIEGTGEKNLVDVTVDTDDDGTGDASITATDGHPFWVADDGQWRDAEDLTPGDMLRTAAGTWVQVTAVDHRTHTTRVHNLTVDDLHTYHVAAGDTDILVHNTTPNFPCTPSGISRQKQDQHVVGTAEYAQRLRLGTPTSAFKTRAEADAYAWFAWKNGTPVAGRPNIRDFEFNKPIGTGPNGGWMTKVRVHIDASGKLHAHPKGREYFSP
ncbi:RHS repeat-associated core domain-containing protein [Stackebrandtia albiflava]|uniref:RHS repeat-associated core domain-containing protein n=1 Tax=Stackebrandtia albiflava TaxID=406432 RepID=UPI0011BF2C07|nr:RHS repeat-associated core domain-containing protein [Stackebrandtia albiflava]